MQAHFVKWRRGARETEVGMGVVAREWSRVGRGRASWGRFVRSPVTQNARGAPSSTDLRLGRFALILEKSLAGVWGHAVEAAYGRWPMPPSSVMVSPLMNLKSGPQSWSTARPISVSTLP